MKRIISVPLALFSVLLFFTLSPLQAQQLEKGNLLGLHVLEVTLEPGVTMDEYMAMVKEEIIPAVEKHWKGMQMKLVKGIRGEQANRFGFLYLFESDEVRNRFFNADGTYSEAGNAALEKFQPVSDKLDKLGSYTRVYTDWIVE
jgi:hypothetical protein